MPKYTDEVKAKAIQMAKDGVALAEIQRQLGPNPKAIQRYCKKAGVALPKKEKVAKPKAEKKAEAPKAPAKK